MIYRREFFDLQWQFATGVAALAGLSLADALLAYTSFYARFGLGRAFDAADPNWREYIDGLGRSAAPRDWTYAFYRSRLPDRGASGVIASVGCFSCARLSEGRVRLHFHNAEAAGVAPLAAQRQAQRRDELRRLAEQVRRREGATVKVVGASWLYNLDAYRRLFPAAYLATATACAPRFNGMPLWGQFLDREGALRQRAPDMLLRRLATQTDARALDTCFEHPVLTCEAAASVFIEHRGATARPSPTHRSAKRRFRCLLRQAR